MSGAPGIPQNMFVQSANGVNLVSWDLSTGAISYKIQRSLDNVSYTDLIVVSGTPLATSYLDSAVTLGLQYWYKVLATNASGDSSYTNPQSVVPYPSGEMNLAAIRLAAQQRADRVNSQFVSKPEWTSYINQSMFELYDLLTTTYEDYFISPVPVLLQTDGTTFIYPLPNGTNTFLNGLSPSATITPPAFYKLLGVDLGINTSGNGYTTLNKFNFIDRNRYVYPTQNSPSYGVMNMQYRVMGSNIQFIPTPTANQYIRLWYIPRLTELLQDTDTTTMGISGWIEYVIVRAAKYALDKEEADTTKLDQQIIFLKSRIEESASNRDAGIPDTISDTRRNNSGNGWGNGSNGPMGGFAMLAMPASFTYHSGNGYLTDSIFSGQSGLGYAAFAILFSYGAYRLASQLRGGITFARIGQFNRLSCSFSTFANHISSILFRRTQKQMTRINTSRVITGMTDKQAGWNRTIMELPRISMRSKVFTIPSNSTVTAFRLTSIPFPAVISKLINFIPKTVHNLIVTPIQALWKAF